MNCSCFASIVAALDSKVVDVPAATFDKLFSNLVLGAAYHLNSVKAIDIGAYTLFVRFAG